MNNFFYLRLAISNMKKNAKTYIPYLMTCVITTALFYIIKSLSINQDLDTLIVGGSQLKHLLSFGTAIVGGFSVIFLFYTNSFLVRRRKKEFGLFNILGMEKKHIGKIMAYESIFTALISIGLGLIIGISLDKVMFLLIAKMFNASIPLGFHITIEAIKTTCVLFVIIFLLMFIYMLGSIHLANPIELLHGANFGEREPKAKWFMTLLGIICLGFGYYIAMTTDNPLAALSLFFVAVIFVILGTYLLFTSGSITLLKLLKKNKNFYYKTNHFINISGMIYRMKQNAVGLANICILSTMVLVMLSTTMSMWIGMNDALVEHYPSEIAIIQEDTEDYDKSGRDNALMISQTVLDSHSLTGKNWIEYSYLGFATVQKGNAFSVDGVEVNLSNLNNITYLYFVCLDDYNHNLNTNEVLNDNEILVYYNDYALKNEYLKLFDYDFKVKKELTSFKGSGLMTDNISSTYFIVVKDMDIITDIDKKQSEAYGSEAVTIQHSVAYDIEGNKEALLEYYNDLSTALTDSSYHYTINSRTAAYDNFKAVYGGFLFIGVFLSALFLMGTILIIYYKQVTEGYEDKERYDIMQKVGMDHKEVKHSIHSQILMVFFLPLLVACIHIVFAFPLIEKLLSALYLTNTKLYILCTISCIGVFSIVYVCIYLLTSKTYYAIVKRG